MACAYVERDFHLLEGGMIVTDGGTATIATIDRATAQVVKSGSGMLQISLPALGELRLILYDVLTELFSSKSLCDPTNARAFSKFGDAGVIDILASIGNCTTLAMVLNVSRSALSDGKSLPLTPMPAQFDSRVPGIVCVSDYQLTEAQSKEFAPRPHSRL